MFDVMTERHIARSVKRLYLFSTSRGEGGHIQADSESASRAFQPLRGSLRATPNACDGFFTLELWLDGSVISPIQSWPYRVLPDIENCLYRSPSMEGSWRGCSR